MSTGLRLSILTPERRLVEGVSIEEATLPGSEGEIQILPGHAAMIGTLQTGVFSFKAVGKGAESAPVVGVISSGFFEVKEDEVAVMAETLELSGEIDVSRAKKAQQVAEAALNEASLDEHQFKKYQLKLQRALIRQSLAGKS